MTQTSVKMNRIVISEGQYFEPLRRYLTEIQLNIIEWQRIKICNNCTPKFVIYRSLHKLILLTKVFKISISIITFFKR